MVNYNQLIWCNEVIKLSVESYVLTLEKGETAIRGIKYIIYFLYVSKIYILPRDIVIYMAFVPLHVFRSLCIRFSQQLFLHYN